MKQNTHRIARIGLALALALTLALGALPFGPPAALADAGAEALPGEAIVVLRPGGDIAAVARRARATVVGHVPGSTLYRLRAAGQTDRLLRALDDDRDVALAEPNLRLGIAEVQQFSLAFSGQFALPSPSAQAIYEGQWAATRLGLPAARTRAATGGGVVIAVVDTGVDALHPALAGRVLAGWDFVDGDANPMDAPAGLDGNANGLVDEAAGHGTFVAGLIALVAPDARILPQRVLNSDGQGTLYDVAAGIHAAVDAGANVVNLSLGTRRDTGALREAVAYARAKGAVVVAAAGNRRTTDRTGAVLYPARYPGVVAVGATDSDDVLASFSTWGRELALVAPGAAIFSSYLNGSYAWWSGTSMAAAFTSGATALVQAQHRDWSPEQVLSRLQATAVNIDGMNTRQVTGKLGAGRLDADAATR